MPPDHDDPSSLPLHEETKRRYLNYAMSVITSRARPDVRDGLKPVQRRILYAMFNNLRIYPDSKHRKCALVVGDVLGKLHPHGDTSVYDALVRMAQDFSLRVPLVDGHGNFGSLDGDGAAAMRYTECRLAWPAMSLLDELKQQTVGWRPNYDGQLMEPIVLPAKYPNLLVNGATGIAVGMATNIPPHHLGEVISACLALIEDPALETKDLLKHIKGPDFPTGGQMLNNKRELREIYETGQGAVRVRGEFKLEEGKRGAQSIIVTSIPYAVSKSTIVEQIGEIIMARKLPLLLDVRDESTEKDGVRIVMELKKDADPELVMAYLYKHTPLQTNFNVNLTALIPTANSEVATPDRLDLKRLLSHFLEFRLEVTRKRFQFELSELEKRIHLLEGFAKIYDALDEVIKIIRKSDDKADAAAKLMKRFDLDAEQVDAILELKLYKLARLQILMVEQELGEKQAEAKKIRAILKSEKALWGVVAKELEKIQGDNASDKRRTRVGGGGDEVEFTEEHFIVAEDAHVVLTRDGWVKRVGQLKDPNQTRTREGDEVVQVLVGSTRALVAFFTNFGSAYVTRINDVTPSTGYGDPVQKLFKFKDGERVVGGLSLDPRLLASKDQMMLAVSKGGYAMRFALTPHTEVSTRAGRRFAKTAEGDEILGVVPVADNDLVVAATSDAHGLACKAAEINVLAGPGRGVTLIKVEDDARVIGFAAVQGKHEGLSVESEKGKVYELTPKEIGITSRGGKGHMFSKRDGFAKVLPRPVMIPTLPEPAGPGGAGAGSGGKNGQGNLVN